MLQVLNHLWPANLLAILVFSLQLQLTAISAVVDSYLCSIVVPCSEDMQIATLFIDLIECDYTTSTHNHNFYCILLSFVRSSEPCKHYLQTSRDPFKAYTPPILCFSTMNKIMNTAIKPSYQPMVVNVIACSGLSFAKLIIPGSYPWTGPRLHVCIA